MRILDEPSLTWDEWNKTKPEHQFDHVKFTALGMVEKDEKIRNLIYDMADHILSVSNPVKILLFGSRARSEPTPNSDIDIAVIFKRKRDITQKYRKMKSMLVNKSPMDVDIKTGSMQQIKNSRENMADVYYYVMRDSVIIYQQGDNCLYEFLEKGHMFLGRSYNSAKLNISSGLTSYFSIQQSLGVVFLAGHRPMPASKSNLLKIADQLPSD